jgi:mannan-binding protein
MTCTRRSIGVVKLVAALLAVTGLPAAAQQPQTPPEAAPAQAAGTPPAEAKAAAGATHCDVTLNRSLINQAQAEEVCPSACASLGGWNGNWFNTGSGQSVCGCRPRPTGDLFAGEQISNHANAQSRCPGVCSAGQGTWTNAWRDSPRGGWCGCANFCRTPCRGDKFSDTVRYDSVFRKACHNCYETQYAPTLGSAFDSTENIEVDFYDTERGVLFGTKPDYWYVRHDYCCGNENNCVVDGVGNFALRACLDNIKERSNLDRNHPVYTVFLDKKENWGEDRMPSDLDDLVTSILGDRLYKPAELKGTVVSLREAAKADRWPAMDALRGHILVVLTGGQMVSLDSNKTLAKYVEDRRENAALFVAPDTNSFEDVLDKPDGFDNSTAAWVVFYNIQAGDAYTAQTVYQERYVSRLWGGLEDGEAYGSYVEDCVNFIALYDYKKTNLNDGRVTGVLAPQ